MTTPGEIDRIIRSLVRTIEERDATIKNLDEAVAYLQAMLDIKTRKELGFPPRNLTPSYATYQDRA